MGFKRRDDEFHGETVFHDLGAGKAQLPLWRRGHVRIAPSQLFTAYREYTDPPSIALLVAWQGAPLTVKVCNPPKVKAAPQIFPDMNSRRSPILDSIFCVSVSRFRIYVIFYQQFICSSQWHINGI